MKVGLLSAGVLAIGLASLPTVANATKTVTFSAHAGNGDFLSPIAPGSPIDDRVVGFQGTIIFANDVVTGTIGLADIASFSVDMFRGIHIIGAPANVYLAANYHFTFSDLTDFSLTLTGGQATSGHWSLTPISPQSFTVPGFVPVTGFDVNGADDPSITFYQSTPNGKIAFAKTGFDRFTSTSVPEPASWMIMIVGFGATGVALRRGIRTRVAFA